MNLITFVDVFDARENAENDDDDDDDSNYPEIKKLVLVFTRH